MPPSALVLKRRRERLLARIHLGLWSAYLGFLLLWHTFYKTLTLFNVTAETVLAWILISILKAVLRPIVLVSFVGWYGVDVDAEEEAERAKQD